MKYILLLASLVSFYAQAHSLDESLQILTMGGSDTRALYVRFHAGKMNLKFTQQNLKLLGLDAKIETITDDPAFKTLQRYRVLSFKKALSEASARELLIELYSDPSVEFAIFEPKVEDAVMKGASLPKFMAETPDFENLQDYLNPAPIGIDARYAWDFPGGTGKNVKIIDIESGFYTNHVDLPTPYWYGDTTDYTDHGTAVSGELVAKRDGQGVTGIAYDSSIGFIPRTSPQGDSDYHGNLARVITKAASMLEAGDVLVLELHSIGPHGNFLPVEFWTPVFDAVKAATDRNILCVAAGGNGYTNLDDPRFNRAFDLTNRNSNCVLVGASNHNIGGGGNTHSRADFSNYGTRIDAHGFGENVVTTGYGDLQSGGVAQYYTRSFSGTSSATPIVSGAVVLLSSMAQERGELVTPAQIREALRNSGTRQAGRVEERIGNFPNLKELIDIFKF